MKLLLDTQVLLWAAITPERLNATAHDLLTDDANELIFSVVSIWETAIKAALGRPDFAVTPHRFRRTLLDNGYRELDVTGPHALGIGDLPAIHRDPFDRLLLAQCRHEGAILVTSDSTLARYPVPTRLV